MSWLFTVLVFGPRCRNLNGSWNYLHTYRLSYSCSYTKRVLTHYSRNLVGFSSQRIATHNWLAMSWFVPVPKNTHSHKGCAIIHLRLLDMRRILHIWCDERSQEVRCRKTTATSVRNTHTLPRAKLILWFCVAAKNFCFFN